MATASKNKSIKITGDGRYPLVPLDQIEIVERPPEGQEAEQLFYNPRSLDSFSPAEMQELLISIRTDGLQQPPQVRAITEDGKPVAIQLIAGERRIRTLLKIVEQDYPCFDEDAKPPKKYRTGATVICKGRFAKVLDHKTSGVAIQMLEHDGVTLSDETREVSESDLRPTVPGSHLYQQVPCRVLYDCTDERALRVAFSENDKHKNLKTKEEIALVERLLAMGLKQGEISDLLQANETWVSQTINFKSQLPTEAYDKLLDGSMTRHVAVNLMSFKAEDRERLFKATIKAAEEDAKKKAEAAQIELETAEDEEEFALADKGKAEASDDHTAAKKAERAVKNAQNRAKKAKEKKDRVEQERGVIKQSHVQAAAAKEDLNPKKAKMLPKDQIQSLIIDQLEGCEEQEFEDPETGETIPQDLAMAVKRTAEMILSGGRDPFDVIRSIQIELGRWEEVEVEESSDEDADEDTDDTEELESELDAEYGDSFDDDEEEEEDYDSMDEIESMGYSDDDDD